jgi:hypothetical protein
MASTASVIRKGMGFDENSIIMYPVYTGETIYSGNFGAIIGGYLKNLTSSNKYTATKIVVVADESANDTGNAATTSSGSLASNVSTANAGDKTVRRCYEKGQFYFSGTGFAQTDVGKIAYATDNETISVTAGAGRRVGTVERYVSTTELLINLNVFPNDNSLIEASGSLTAVTGTTGGGIMSVGNPFGMPLMIHELILNVTTKASGTVTGDYGVAANGTTSSDTLIDGTNMETTGIHSILTYKGTNGGLRTWAASEHVTGTASASAAGLVGTYKIFFTIV